ncbi:hypothetical protein CAEBREN_24215 [Caenorhabditis brenneri]|uniref:Uncharacterized protein n=1 Tax=Caenorhabditis brenneri TaxID=135651 RepID=G0MMC2_CAEBE|nr:hypothetical protein CAEBREN_24215 [Caenorhabditis brenneri]
MTELEKFLKKEVSEKNGYQIVDYINQYSLTTDWIDTDRSWRVTIRKCGSWSVQLEIEFSDVTEEEHIEFDYVIILNHKNSSAKNAIVFSGRGVIDEKSNPVSISNHKLSTFHRLQGVSFEDMYVKFAVEVIMFYDKDGIRNFMLEDQYDLPLEKVVDGYKLLVLAVDIRQRAPLFVKALDANELSEVTQNNFEKFIQILLGVHIQLES